MATTRPHGYGSEPYGDPFGLGGPLHVVRARAIAGQVVRVVFDEQPIHSSAAGTEDGLNPSNYVVSIVTGQATQPQVVGVGENLVVGPTVAVFAGDERALDIHTDRALIDVIGYRVQVFNVKSKLGGVLAGPSSADFVGVTRIRQVRPARRRVDLVDIKNSPFDGSFSVDGSGDLSIHGGRDGLRKRIFRRITTGKNAFSHLPGYGCSVKLKELAHPQDLISIKSDILQQIRQEPDVAGADVQLSLNESAGILFIRTVVQTSTGAQVETTFQVSENGAIVLS